MKNKEEIRQKISETLDGGNYEALTAILWNEKHEPFQLHKLEENFEFKGKKYHCILIVKTVYCEDDTESVNYSEDIYFEIVP